jgi:hypothetical protein
MSLGLVGGRAVAGKDRCPGDRIPVRGRRCDRIVSEHFRGYGVTWPETIGSRRMPCFVCVGLIWVRRSETGRTRVGVDGFRSHEDCATVGVRGQQIRVWEQGGALKSCGVRRRLLIGAPPYGFRCLWYLGVQRSLRGQRSARQIRGVLWRKPTDWDSVCDGTCGRDGGFWGDVFVKGNSKKAKEAKNCEENSQPQAVGVWLHGVSVRRSFFTSRRPGDGDRIGVGCSKRPKGAMKRETNSRSLMLEVDRLGLGL